MIDDQSIKVVNLLGETNDEDEFNDQNLSKLFAFKYECYVFFSSTSLTNNRSFDVQIGKQVCIIPFRR